MPMTPRRTRSLAPTALDDECCGAAMRERALTTPAAVLERNERRVSDMEANVPARTGNTGKVWDRVLRSQLTERRPRSRVSRPSR